MNKFQLPFQYLTPTYLHILNVQNLFDFVRFAGRIFPELFLRFNGTDIKNIFEIYFYLRNNFTLLDLFKKINSLCIVNHLINISLLRHLFISWNLFSQDNFLKWLSGSLISIAGEKNRVIYEKTHLDHATKEPLHDCCIVGKKLLLHNFYMVSISNKN